MTSFSKEVELGTQIQTESECLKCQRRETPENIKPACFLCSKDSKIVNKYNFVIYITLPTLYCNAALK